MFCTEGRRDYFENPGQSVKPFPDLQSTLSKAARLHGGKKWNSQFLQTLTFHSNRLDFPDQGVRFSRSHFVLDFQNPREQGAGRDELWPGS